MCQDFETGLISLGLSRKLEATSTAIVFDVHSPPARARWFRLHGVELLQAVLNLLEPLQNKP